MVFSDSSRGVVNTKRNKFCWQCGCAVAVNHKFCTSCGSELTESISTSADPFVVTKRQPEHGVDVVDGPLATEYFGGMGWKDKRGAFIVPDFPPPYPMDFIESVKHCFRNCFNFRGRASRSEYWYFVALYPTTLLVLVVSLLLRSQSSNNAIQNADLTVLVFLLVTAFCLAPIPAAGVRRLHDTGHSSAWLLLNFLPVVGGLTILYWLCQEGESTPNRFGPP